MPQLPSGQQVSVSADRALHLAREGNLGACAGFAMRLENLADIAPLIDIIPYQVANVIPTEDEDNALDESDLTLADLDSDRCAWPDEDKRFFLAWLDEPRVQAWMQSMFDELKDLFDMPEEAASDLPDYMIPPPDLGLAGPLGKADTRRGKGRRGR
ncbi:MAG: hypothetical protein JO218_15140 [Burkholderiales bacterium]|nr:hypothetical protein [Burkholderiales bacterium]